MKSEQRAELFQAHAAVRHDSAENSLGQVSRTVDWDRCAAPVRVPHDVMAAGNADLGETGTLERLNNLCSWNSRDDACHVRNQAIRMSRDRWCAYPGRTS